jgi:hypothetical protein
MDCRCRTFIIGVLTCGLPWVLIADTKKQNQIQSSQCIIVMISRYQDINNCGVL